jgi:hypothetical protein
VYTCTKIGSNVFENVRPEILKEQGARGKTRASSQLGTTEVELGPQKHVAIEPKSAIGKNCVKISKTDLFSWLLRAFYTQ